MHPDNRKIVHLILLLNKNICFSNFKLVASKSELKPRKLYIEIIYLFRKHLFPGKYALESTFARYTTRSLLSLEFCLISKEIISVFIWQYAQISHRCICHHQIFNAFVRKKSNLDDKKFELCQKRRNFKSFFLIIK